MRKTLFNLSLGFALTLGVFSFVGCGGGSEAPADTTAAPAGDAAAPAADPAAAPAGDAAAAPAGDAAAAAPADSAAAPKP